MSEGLERAIQFEPRLAAVTPARVAAAFEGFELRPLHGWDWTVRAVRGALYVSLSDRDPAGLRGNADIRDELNALAAKVSKVWIALQERSAEADEAIVDYAWRGWNGPEGEESPDHRAFREALASLDSLSVFLRRAAMMQQVQGPNWQRAAEREQRILRAQCLSPVFVQAFGAEPTFNSWETAKSSGPWPDFYQRIVNLAFGERATPNIEGVLDEARRRDLAHRVSFAPGIIPNEPP